MGSAIGSTRSKVASGWCAAARERVGLARGVMRRRRGIPWGPPAGHLGSETRSAAATRGHWHLGGRSQRATMAVGHVS